MNARIVMGDKTYELREVEENDKAGAAVYDGDAVEVKEEPPRPGPFLVAILDKDEHGLLRETLRVIFGDNAEHAVSIAAGIYGHGNVHSVATLPADFRWSHIDVCRPGYEVKLHS